VGTSEQFAAHPHNLVLDLWLNLGPVGLLAVIAIIATTIRNTLRHPSPLHTVALAILLSTLVHGLVDQFFFVSDMAFLFWLVVFLGQVDTAHSARL